MITDPTFAKTSSKPIIFLDFEIFGESLGTGRPVVFGFPLCALMFSSTSWCVCVICVRAPLFVPLPLYPYLYLYLAPTSVLPCMYCSTGCSSSVPSLCTLIFLNRSLSSLQVMLHATRGRQPAYNDTLLHPRLSHLPCGSAHVLALLRSFHTNPFWA